MRGGRLRARALEGKHRVSTRRDPYLLGMSTSDSTPEPRIVREPRPTDHVVPATDRSVSATDETRPYTPVAGTSHPVHDDDNVVVRDADDRSLHEVHRREKAEFGGFKFGSAFFGWLCAMGTTVLLTALVTAIGAAVGASNGATPEEAADTAMGPLGIVAIVVIALVLFVSYFAGGYVAGRMARFSGAKQGIAVWLWAVIVAIIVAVVTAIAGSQWDILGTLQGFPRIPVTAETATTTGILTAVGAAVVTLIGAILGGLAGMRYHRKVDRVGLAR